jgi:hypothetical protein
MCSLAAIARASDPLDAGSVSGGKTIRRIVLATLKGMGIGFLLGAAAGVIAGWIFVVVTHWGPPPKRPPIEDLSGLAPIVFGVIGAPIGAIVIGFVWAVRAWIATNPPEKAARHRAAIYRTLAFVVPLAMALVAGYFASFAVHNAVQRASFDPYRVRTDWDRQRPGLAAMGVFVFIVIPGLLLAIFAARHAPQPGAMSRLLSRLGLRLEQKHDP